MKKHNELHNLSVDELEQKIADSRKSLQTLKFAHALSPIENPLQIRNLRRQIARYETIIMSKRKQS